MNRTYLALAMQASIVLTMVTVVSWPEVRPVRQQSVWRYAPAAVLQARTNDAARFSDESRMRFDQTVFNRAPAYQAPVGAGELDRTSPFMPPIGVAALGGRVNALVGYARTSLNAPIPYARVVLRNIATGEILARGVANDQGRFSFLDLDGSTYVIELLGPDGSVVATSAMVRLGRGDLLQTEIRTAASAKTVAASFGGAMTSTLPQATTLAANSDVTRTTPTLTTQESPR
jgi:hypothetical protein